MTWNLAGKGNHVSFCRVFFHCTVSEKNQAGFSSFTEAISTLPTKAKDDIKQLQCSIKHSLW